MRTVITGFYVRIERDGRFQALDIAELTDEELQGVTFTEGEARRWTIALAKWIRDNVKVPEQAE